MRDTNRPMFTIRPYEDGWLFVCNACPRQRRRRFVASEKAALAAQADHVKSDVHVRSAAYYQSGEAARRDEERREQDKVLDAIFGIKREPRQGPETPPTPRPPQPDNVSVDVHDGRRTVRWEP